MKKFKIITLTLFFLSFLAASAIAQVQADAEIDVGATVDNALTLQSIQNLDFGDFETGQDGTGIGLDNDEETTNSAGENAQYGIFELQGTNDQNVQISIPSSSINLNEISGTNPSNNMVYEPLIFLTGQNTLIDGSAGETEETYELETGDPFNIYVGGDLSQDTSYEAGIYTGSITLTVQYVE